MPSCSQALDEEHRVLAKRIVHLDQDLFHRESVVGERDDVEARPISMRWMTPVICSFAMSSRVLPSLTLAVIDPDVSTTSAWLEITVKP